MKKLIVVSLQLMIFSVSIFAESFNQKEYKEIQKKCDNNETGSCYTLALIEEKKSEKKAMLYFKKSCTLENYLGCLAVTSRLVFDTRYKNIDKNSSIKYANLTIKYSEKTINNAKKQCKNAKGFSKSLICPLSETLIKQASNGKDEAEIAIEYVSKKKN